MMKRIFALVLSAALALSLASCGGKEPSTPAASSRPAASAPAAELTLNQTEVTLNAPGATYQLKVSGGDAVEWVSADPAVVTVDSTGTVTAVGPGGAAVTAAVGDVTLQCVVYCQWEETPVQPDVSQPEAPAQPTAPEAPAEPAPAPSDSVDLSAFYETLKSKYEFPSSMELADAEITNAFYPGLTDVPADQCLVYANMMSLNMGELVLVRVQDTKDVDGVRAILQARVDSMIDGGAWYPEATEVWTNCSQVVVNGNYVMMAVNQSVQDIVADFNALF